jgi:hypothetical protein
MAEVVVGSAFDLARTHRQEGLGPVERLDLGLLIDAEHHCPFRRVEIEADNVPHLLDEQRVSREFEGLRAMGLEGKARQMRLTVLWLRPVTFAMPRVLQCVPSAGVVSSVRTIRASTWASLIVRGTPGRGSSKRPSLRCKR